VELPVVGVSLERGQPFGVVESVKAVADLLAPASGEVLAANEDLADAPELVNESPYERGWIVRIRLDDAAEHEDLMDADRYRETRPEDTGGVS
jgi:glycine cleavage system H protein